MATMGRLRSFGQIKVAEPSPPKGVSAKEWDKHLEKGSTGDVDDLEGGDPTRLMPRLKKIHKLGAQGLEDAGVIHQSPGRVVPVGDHHKEKDSSFEYAQLGPNKGETGMDPPAIWRPKRLPYQKTAARRKSRLRTSMYQGSAVGGTLGVLAGLGSALALKAPPSVYAAAAGMGLIAGGGVGAFAGGIKEEMRAKKALTEKKAKKALKEKLQAVARERDELMQAQAQVPYGKVRKLDQGTMLYHLTPEKNLKRIQRHGLRPRSSRWGEGRRRSYSNRTYFTTTPESSIDMLDTLKDEDVRLGKRKKPDTYALVTVDPTKVPKMKTMIDPEEPKFSVYNVERIRPPAIVDIKRGTLADIFGKEKTSSKLPPVEAYVSGPSAAGKTTYIKKHFPSDKFHRLHSDQYRSVVDGKRVFDWARAIKDAKASGKPVVVDSLSIHEPLASAAKQRVLVDVSKKEAVKRHLLRGRGDPKEAGRAYDFFNQEVRPVAKRLGFVKHAARKQGSIVTRAKMEEIDKGRKRLGMPTIKRDWAAAKRWEAANRRAWETKVAYKLQGHTEVGGLRIAIENRKGSVRTGKSREGVEWRTKMKNPYGYIVGTVGKDGDAVDAYVGPKKDADKAFVVHQHKPDGTGYDEDKVMLAFPSKKSAKEAFLKHYDSKKFLGPISVVTMDRLRDLVARKKKLVKISHCPTEALHKLADTGLKV